MFIAEYQQQLSAPEERHGDMRLLRSRIEKVYISAINIRLLRSRCIE
jgi:hypothetical protein